MKENPRRAGPPGGSAHRATGNAARRALLADDADFQLGDDVGMQADRDGGLAERLDGLIELDALALDLHAVLLEEVDEVLRGDRAEELAFLRGLAPLLVHERLDPVAYGLGVALDAVGLGVRLPLDVIEVLEVARGGAQRELFRDEEVAGVAVGDVADLAAAAELLHVVEQDDFHGPSYWGRGALAGFPHPS